ncbi:MAG: hypothetical protein ACM3QY_14310 [Candidatus Levyibacteriota bacterium]
MTTRVLELDSRAPQPVDTMRLRPEMVEDEGAFDVGPMMRFAISVDNSKEGHKTDRPTWQESTAFARSLPRRLRRIERTSQAPFPRPALQFA